MTTDFETHPRGTAEEIRLSRNLARAIEDITEQYGSLIPQSVMTQYSLLLEHYKYHIEND
jgi:hypothetical protein